MRSLRAAWKKESGSSSKSVSYELSTTAASDPHASTVNAVLAGEITFFNESDYSSMQESDHDDGESQGHSSSDSERIEEGNAEGSVEGSNGDSAHDMTHGGAGDDDDLAADSGDDDDDSDNDNGVDSADINTELGHDGEDDSKQDDAAKNPQEVDCERVKSRTVEHNAKTPECEPAGAETAVSDRGKTQKMQRKKNTSPKIAPRGIVAFGSGASTKRLPVDDSDSLAKVPIRCRSASPSMPLRCGRTLGRERTPLWIADAMEKAGNYDRQQLLKAYKRALLEGSEANWLFRQQLLKHAAQKPSAMHSAGAAATINQKLYNEIKMLKSELRGARAKEFRFRTLFAEMKKDLALEQEIFREELFALLSKKLGGTCARELGRNAPAKPETRDAANQTSFDGSDKASPQCQLRDLARPTVPYGSPSVRDNVSMFTSITTLHKRRHDSFSNSSETSSESSFSKLRSPPPHGANPYLQKFTPDEEGDCEDVAPTEVASVTYTDCYTRVASNCSYKTDPATKVTLPLDWRDYLSASSKDQKKSRELALIPVEDKEWHPRCFSIGTRASLNECGAPGGPDVTMTYSALPLSKQNRYEESPESSVHSLLSYVSSEPTPSEFFKGYRSKQWKRDSVAKQNRAAERSQEIGRHELAETARRCMTRKGETSPTSSEKRFIGKRLNSERPRPTSNLYSEKQVFSKGPSPTSNRYAMEQSHFNSPSPTSNRYARERFQSYSPSPTSKRYVREQSHANSPSQTTNRYSSRLIEADHWLQNANMISHISASIRMSMGASYPPNPSYPRTPPVAVYGTSLSNLCASPSSQRTTAVPLTLPEAPSYNCYSPKAQSAIRHPASIGTPLSCQSSPRHAHVHTHDCPSPSTAQTYTPRKLPTLRITEGGEERYVAPSSPVKLPTATIACVKSCEKIPFRKTGVKFGQVTLLATSDVEATEEQRQEGSDWWTMYSKRMAAGDDETSTIKTIVHSDCSSSRWQPKKSLRTLTGSEELPASSWSLWRKMEKQDNSPRRRRSSWGGETYASGKEPAWMILWDAARSFEACE